MNTVRWNRHPIVFLVTLVIAAVYFYGYVNKVSQTQSYSPVQFESGPGRLP